MNKVLSIAAVSCMCMSCGNLSPEAKKITGNYYNAQISSELPVFELNGDGTCIVRNIHPDVLTLEVAGTWNVEDDSLVIFNDLTTVKAKGDTSIMGDVAPRITRKVVSHDGSALILEKDGIEYLYNRKNTK
ncbi:MAG: hypothetical protein K1V87_09560 [Muribaculum sp.]